MSDLKQKYIFVLEWEDLPENFREEKIDEVVEKMDANADIDEGDDAVDKRAAAEKFIEAHFPIYF